ncbi:MAG: solute carrier family 26 protein [Deltaproteobacteria bacterium]|jgi:SulP family sulfate permease|nr:solute carrier family 26 protein [Deltaproteobacteria bacterium]MBW2533760.1 solute carrier family 26 protein [Deltaproteobacteria bacterium]
MLHAAKTVIPLLSSLEGYDKKQLRGDLAAGLTVAVMLIPQGMAYAMLAGLPPIVGLYASTVPLALYALFGTSRQLAVGPVAMVSLMVAAAVGQLAEPGSGDYLALAVMLALLVGLIQLGMGIARLGFLVNFLSHPVVSGFTSAAALIIGFSQLKHLLGVDLERSHHVHAVLADAATRLGEVQPITLAVGVGSIAALLLLKRWKPSLPGALIVVVASTLLVWGLGLADRGVAIVGHVPAGLPSPTVPALDLTLAQELLPIAVAISMVGFMESISVAKAFATKNHYEIDANRELVGLGVANIAGGMLQGYPVTGGFSRTAVNAQAGAKSGIASLITAAVIALTLLFLTSLFHFLPKAVLAAIIMVAVFGLVDLDEVKHLYRVKRGDLALLATTFVATLLLGIEAGILIGVAASLVAVIYRITRPHTAVLGRIPGTHLFRNVKRFPEAETFDGVLVLRIDAQFYFGNVSFLKETLKRQLRAAESPVRAVVFSASSINQLDSSAAAALEEIVVDCRERGVELYFAEVRGPVMDVLRRAGFDRLLGEDHFTLSVTRAVSKARAYVASLDGEPLSEDAAFVLHEADGSLDPESSLRPARMRTARRVAATASRRHQAGVAASGGPIAIASASR